MSDEIALLYISHLYSTRWVCSSKTCSNFTPAILQLVTLYQIGRKFDTKNGK